jgi:hypothetical protein
MKAELGPQPRMEDWTLRIMRGRAVQPQPVWGLGQEVPRAWSRAHGYRTTIEIALPSGGTVKLADAKLGAESTGRTLLENM